MPPSLEADNPNLQAAARRLRRVQWTWAALFLAMGVMTLIEAFRSGTQAGQLIVGTAWFLGALLLAVAAQPALLAMVAVTLVLTLILLLPAGGPLGPDPLAAVLGSSPVEAWASAVVRVILALTAWNQFLFYRMLYGTASAAGLGPDLPAIPEVVPN